ncbi:Conserved membrane protein YqhR [Parageobacillus thermantarcticus]|uniref:Conserved membrane protein YqhR n=1 Tax=Parageobacillus thermantarcticus TaxID=186116 RepID=A0A1I0SZI6_9BACL|nr:YqhR family membrane protein [Parageobacillus thermantarcticus]SFA44935.1 Conserved membrane protein YqhR [Parageobacillus thermantarcticus]
MAENQAQFEQNKRERPMSLLMKVMIIGFIGGVFWSLLGYLAYFFHFTEISPNMILLPWVAGDWKYGKLGNYIAIFLIGLLSILVALIYYVVLRQIKGMWAGVLYGFVLWLAVFYGLNPLFPNLEAVAQLERNTIITTLCLYVLYGVFIGYSISFETQEMNRQTQSPEANK